MISSILSFCFNVVKTTSLSDFKTHQAYNDEPHATRRKEILAKYPEIKKLYGPCPRTKWIILGTVLFQYFAAYSMSQSSSWLIVLLATYLISGMLNHMMSLALHELSHNLAFRKPLPNRFLALFANLPMGIPAAVQFKRYHLEHHRFQGEDVVDTDVPLAWEGVVFCNTPMKMLWAFLQPAFYALRPSFNTPKPYGTAELLNLSTVLLSDFLVYHFWGPKALFYLVAGTLLGMGLHPVAGHFIAEHYVFIPGWETYSYYGPLNFITFNVGYHNEHHDFPYIAGSRLPEVRRIAPEFYDKLPHHASWTSVIYNYIVDPSMGPYARVKRSTITKEERQELFSKEKAHHANMDKVMLRSIFGKFGSFFGLMA